MAQRGRKINIYKHRIEIFEVLFVNYGRNGFVKSTLAPDTPDARGERQVFRNPEAGAAEAQGHQGQVLLPAPGMCSSRRPAHRSGLKQWEIAACVYKFVWTHWSFPLEDLAFHLLMYVFLCLATAMPSSFGQMASQCPFILKGNFWLQYNFTHIVH
jgi:hypothetical protein